MRFQQQFFRECVEGSAIAPELFNSAIAFVEDSGFWEPNRALGQDVSRFWQTRKPHSYGAIACFRQYTGEVWQAKPQQPRTDFKKGTPLKYETVAGAGSRAFFPAIPGHPNYWADLADSETPIIITEGGKKALALLSLGYQAIALTGVNGGYRANERIDGEVVKLEKPELIADLTPFCHQGRKIILAFDQDSKPKTRRRVAAAIWKFGGLLAAAGCDVAIAEWSPQYKGVDDLIVGAGVDAARQAIADALPFDQWKALDRLRNRIRRSADVSIGDAEFSAATLPDSGIVALHGGKGTGKSTAIAKALAESGDRWLSITSLISLARQQAAAWGGVFLNDGDRYGSHLTKNGIQMNGGSVCIPSLLASKPIHADTVLIDEVTTVLDFLLSSPLANKDGLRPLLLGEFSRRVKSARRVIVADADLDEPTIAYVEALRGERAFLIQSDRKPLQWEAITYSKKNELIAGFLDAVEAAPKNQVVLFFTDAKGTVETLARVLADRKIKTLQITQDTSGGQIERRFLESEGRDLPGLIRSGVRAILCSPSVGQGFNLKQYTERISSIWAIYQGASIDADGILQQLDRVRANIPRNIYVPAKGSGYSRHSRASSAREWLREFKSLSTKTAQLVRHSLKPDSAIAAESIDWENQNLALLAHYESNRNSQMMGLRAEVFARLRHEGKTITVRPDSKCDKASKAAAKAVSEAAEKAKLERWTAIAIAPPIDDDEARRLEQEGRKRALDVSEVRSLESFYIRQFYRLQKTSLPDVEFDNDERTRKHIKRLEEYVIDGVSTERSAASIDRNSTTPQDWNPAALRRWLLVETGAGQLIDRIWRGEVDELDGDEVRAIASIIQKHSQRFKVAFGFRVEAMPAQQIVGQLLDFFGIKRICRRVREGDTLIRIYSIDATHLEKLRAVIGRRFDGVPPLLSKDLNEGGGTSPSPHSALPSALQTLTEMLSVALTDHERREIEEAILHLGAPASHPPEVEPVHAAIAQPDEPEPPDEVDGFRVGDRVRFDLSAFSAAEQKEIRKEGSCPHEGEIGTVVGFAWSSFGRTWRVRVSVEGKAVVTIPDYLKKTELNSSVSNAA